MNKLDVKALGLALGIFWGLYCIILGLVAMLCGYGTSLLEVIASYYIGYKPTLLGSLIGGIWGFIDGLICGVITAWLYNKLVR
jgi:hypothetical protein